MTIVVIVAIRFCWPALPVAAVMLHIETPSEMLAVVIGAVILLAAALRDRLSGRSF
jgi:hypothetical protein